MGVVQVERGRVSGVGPVLVPDVDGVRFPMGDPDVAPPFGLPPLPVASDPPRRSAVEERRVNELAGFLAHYFGYPHPRVTSACGLPPPFPRVPESPYAQRCAVCLDRYHGGNRRGGRVPYSPYGRWVLVPIRAGGGGGDLEAEVAA